MSDGLNIGLMFSFRRTDTQRSFAEVYRDDLDLIRQAEQLFKHDTSTPPDSHKRHRRHS